MAPTAPLNENLSGNVVEVEVVAMVALPLSLPYLHNLLDFMFTAVKNDSSRDTEETWV